MLFLNTRPTDRADALTQTLQAENIDVIALPLLELQALPYSAQLADQFKQLLNVDVIVVVSPMAVDVGMRYLKQAHVQLQQLAHIRWIAVGETTARCLQQYGIQSLVPSVETSEGMLQIAELKALQSDAHIAFWRGIGGRQFMMEQLANAGHQILNMLLYQRGCPIDTHLEFAQHIDRIQHTKDVVTLITSEASWLNWLMLTDQFQAQMRHIEYWVLGERLAAVLKQYAQMHQIMLKIHQVDYLKPAYLLDILHLRKGTV